MSISGKSLRAGIIVTLFIFPAFFLLGQTAQKAAPSAKDTAPVIMNGKVPQPKPGQRKKLVFQEELSIGQAEGDENYMFGERIVFSADKNGNFYVVDYDRKHIKKYDPSGKYLLTMGRAGQGPGEFQDLSQVRFDRSGNLYVVTVLPQEIKYLDENGKFIRQVKLPGMFGDLYELANGFVASLITQVATEGKMGTEIKIGLFSWEAKAVSVFYTRSDAFRPPASRAAGDVAKFAAEILSAAVFQPQPHYEVAVNESIFFGSSEKYDIQVYDAQGKKARTIARQYDPLKVGDKDKAFVIDTMVPMYPKMLPGVDPKDISRQIVFPKTKPAYATFSLMENGWLLVCAEYIWHEYSLFDLFDDKGVYVGQFKAKLMPDNLFFKNGKAYNVETIDDYKYVKRYSFKIVDY